MRDSKLVAGIKLALSTVAGIGITMLCGHFTGGIASSVGGSGIKKACMAVGGAVIAGMLTNQAEKYIAEEVDSVADLVDKLQMAGKTAEEGA